MFLNCRPRGILLSEYYRRTEADKLGSFRIIPQTGFEKHEVEILRHQGHCLQGRTELQLRTDLSEYHWLSSILVANKLGNRVCAHSTPLQHSTSRNW